MSKSDAYKRGLDGKGSPRDFIDTAFGSLTSSKEERDAYEQGKIDRARIQAEKKAREEKKG